jgi:hypothetical protein
MRAKPRTRSSKALFAAIAAPMVIASFGCGHLAVLPAAPSARGPSTPEQRAIESAPVCIGSAVASVGVLSDVLYYRAIATDDGRVAVGYFAFFSEERPWGNNWLTWTVVPALAVDLVYSRAFLVAPGVQRALFGAGDVEGVGVVYDVAADGSLQLDHAMAEDRTERMVHITREAAFALDPARPTFYSDVWSHQLGAHGARSPADLSYERCYVGESIRPLPESVARSFRVERRAIPAHVERLGGRRIDLDEAPRSPSVPAGAPVVTVQEARSSPWPSVR